MGCAGSSLPRDETNTIWRDIVASAKERLGSAVCLRMLEALRLDRLQIGGDGGAVIAEVSVEPAFARPECMARVRAAVDAALEARFGRGARAAIAVAKVRAPGSSSDDGRPARSSRSGRTRTPRSRSARPRFDGALRRPTSTAALVARGPARDDATGRTASPSARLSQSGEEWERAELNDALSLDSFVGGAANRIVHRLARDVAESPGRDANPLMLYGASGTGKTHLLQGIAQRARAEMRDGRVIYATAETFGNRFAASIRTRSVQRFRNRLRDTDFLVLDDVQLLLRRTKAQEELLHTLDALTARKKQVVIGADMHPRQLEGFHPALLGRLVSGIVIGVGIPDHQTRLGIVANQARLSGVNLSSEVAELLARRCRTNVRELVGAVKKLGLVVSRLRVPIDETMARRILREDVPTPANGGSPSLEEISRRVSRVLGVEAADLRGASRREVVTLGRRLAMVLARRHVDATLREIGAHFGHKSGASVSAAQRVIEKLRSDEDGHVGRIYKRLDTELADDYGTPPERAPGRARGRLRRG